MARHYDDNPGELVIVNPSERGGAVLYEENPRGRRKRRGGGTAKQRAWRKKFGQMYGGGRKRRATNPAKKRKGRRKARFGSVMRSVKRRGRPVSRSAWRASGYRRNPRRYRRNPNGGAVRPTIRSITNVLVEAAQGALGAVAIDMAMGQLVTRGIIPATMLTPQLYPVVKGGVAIGFGLVANMLPLPAAFKRIANEGVKGSLVCTLRDTIAPFVRDTFPLGQNSPQRMRYATEDRSGYMGWRGSGRAMVPGRMGEYLGNSASMSTRERQAYYPSWGQLGTYMNY